MRTYTIRFYTEIETKNGHKHPMSEVDIEAENLEEAKNIVRKGYLEIQEGVGMGDSEWINVELKDLFN